MSPGEAVNVLHAFHQHIVAHGGLGPENDRRFKEALDALPTGTPALRWEEIEHDGAWWAYSGDLIVGMVVKVIAGSRAGVWTWQLSAVHTRYITKGSGDVRSASAGKTCLFRAWTRWLEHAGLLHRPHPTQDSDES